MLLKKKKGVTGSGCAPLRGRKGEEPSEAVSFPASQVKDSSFHPGVATPIKGKGGLSPPSIIKNYN